MCWPYAWLCRPSSWPPQWLGRVGLWLQAQAGAFSPFMFGLLMGMAVLSSQVSIYATKELESIETRRMALQTAQAQDVRQALELSILTEGSEFNRELDLNRALALTEGATLRTRGGEDLHVVVREGDTEFGLRRQTALITTSDDPLLRARLEQLADEEALQSFDGGDNVVLFDSSAARREQVETSIARLEQLAEAVYGYYAGH